MICIDFPERNIQTVKKDIVKEKEENFPQSRFVLFLCRSVSSVAKLFYSDTTFSSSLWKEILNPLSPVKSHKLIFTKISTKKDFSIPNIIYTDTLTLIEVSKFFLDNTFNIYLRILCNVVWTSWYPAPAISSPSHCFPPNFEITSSFPFFL